MKVKIKSKRFVLKGIRQGNYCCVSSEMLNMHCGKIAKVVNEHRYSYVVKFDGEEELNITWCWPKWCCKIIKR